MIIGTLLVFLLYTCELSSVVNAAQAVLPPQEKPLEYASVPGCYIKDINKMLSFNESYSPEDGKSCVRYTCGYDGYTDIFGCFAQSFEGDCVKVPGNRSLPYPECCDGVDCSQGKGTNTPKDISAPNTNEESKIEDTKNSQTEDVYKEENFNLTQGETGNNRSSKLLQTDGVPFNETQVNTTEIQPNGETATYNTRTSTEGETPESTPSDIQSTKHSEVPPEALISEISYSTESLPVKDSYIPSEDSNIKNFDPIVNNPSPVIQEDLTLEPKKDIKKVDPRVNNPAPEIQEDLTLEPKKDIKKVDPRVNNPAPEIQEDLTLEPKKDIKKVDPRVNNPASVIQEDLTLEPKKDIKKVDPRVNNPAPEIQKDLTLEPKKDIKKVDPRVNNPAPEIHEDLTLEELKATESSLSNPKMTENLETQTPQPSNYVLSDIKEERSALDQTSSFTDVKPTENDDVIQQPYDVNVSPDDLKEKTVDVRSEPTERRSDQEGSSGSKDVENLGNAAKSEETTTT